MATAYPTNSSTNMNNMYRQQPTGHLGWDQQPPTMPTAYLSDRPSSMDNLYQDPASHVGSQQPPPPPEDEKKNSKSQKFNRIMNKMSKPLNKAADRFGCEAFNPQELDLEVVKAARILRSFCIDGFMASESDTASQSSSSTKKKSSHGKDRKALRKIPAKAIQNCKGLAIFTCMRFGLHIGGGNGCGILLRHLPDGSWSAPSGIHMANLTGGLVAGLDVYDCVAVINTEEGMEGFTRVRGTIGGEVAATVGPLGAGQVGDLAVSKKISPVWTYTKNRGLYLGAHINGTVFVERTNENPRFYGKEGIRHAEILSGNVKPPVGTCDMLYQTLNAIEGKPYRAEDLPPPYEDVVKN